MINSLSLIIICALIFLFFVFFYNNSIENFRGGGGGPRFKGGGLRFRGGGAWRRGLNSELYLRNFRRRGGWYNIAPISWFVAPVAPCKKGCTPNGCPYPGNTYDECIWASDCYGC